MVYKRRRSYSRPGYSKRRKTIARTYRRRRRTSNYSRSYRYKPSALSKSTKKVVKMGQGLPRIMLIMMPYRWAAALTTQVSGGSSFNVFNMNSPYDPDYTGAGSSARFFDTFMNTTMFTNYVVYRVDIMVVFRTAASTTDDTMAFVQFNPVAMAASQAPSTIFADGSAPYYYTRMLSRFDGDKPSWVFKKSMHLTEVLGISKTKLYGDPNYTGTHTSSPYNKIYMNVGIADDPEDATISLKVDVEVYIKYHMRCSRNIFETS